MSIQASELPIAHHTALYNIHIQIMSIQEEELQQVNHAA